MILAYMYRFLKKHEKTGDKDAILELLDFMKDLGLNMEHFKEHLMVLCMDKKTVESFDNIASTTKAAFTKTFNTESKDDLVGKKGKKAPAGGKSAAAGKAVTTPAADVDDIQNSEDEDEEAAAGE